MGKTKKCENCKTLNEENSKFCEKCGNSLNQEDIATKPQEKPINNISCPFCGQQIPMNIAKCNHCGEWLNPSAKPKTPNTILLGVVGLLLIILGIFIMSLLLPIGLIILIIAIILAVK